MGKNTKERSIIDSFNMSWKTILDGKEACVHRSCKEVLFINLFIFISRKSEGK